MEESHMALFSRRDKDFGHMDRFGKVMPVEEYYELERLSPDRKYEYINGKAYMMSGGSVGHDRIRRNIESTLDHMLSSGSCQVFGVDVQVLVGRKKDDKPHYVYPDTTISCNAADGQPDNTLIEAPRVVVEVLSPGTEYKDRGIKFRAYQHCPTIQEIVLVNQFLPLVDVWRRSEELPENPHAWYCRHYGPDEAVDLISLNIQLAMSEIYRGLDFKEEEEEEEDDWTDN
jgi:Uma2 family endonuclease